jgi:hypothetical protein
MSTLPFLKLLLILNCNVMFDNAVKVDVIPKENIGPILYKGRVMVFQKILEQYCYIPGF